jgi:hypothetical protein
MKKEQLNFTILPGTHKCLGWLEWLANWKAIQPTNWSTGTFIVLSKCIILKGGDTGTFLFEEDGLGIKRCGATVSDQVVVVLFMEWLEQLESDAEEGNEEWEEGHVTGIDIELVPDLLPPLKVEWVKLWL